MYTKITVLDRVALPKKCWETLQSLSERPMGIYPGGENSINERLRRSIRSSSSPVSHVAESKELFCGMQMTVPEREMNELVALLHGTDCIITCWTPIPNNVLAELASSGTAIRHIAAWTNFIEGRVDLDYAQQMGIDITVIPDYGTEAVAQYVIALIYHHLSRMNLLEGKESEFARWFSELRMIEKQAKRTIRGDWRFESLKRGTSELDLERLSSHTLDHIPLTGGALSGKKLGIIGLGRVGRQLSGYASDLGMEVLFFSKHEKNASMREIFSSCDYVSLNLPPVGAEGLISPEFIAVMKPGSVLINTSVGNVISDERSMFETARQVGVILALDVYRGLPPLALISKTRKKDKRLIIPTYRNGWLTKEALLKKADSLIENIRSIL